MHKEEERFKEEVTKPIISFSLDHIEGKQLQEMLRIIKDFQKSNTEFNIE